jgi:hypothetical protein
MTELTTRTRTIMKKSIIAAIAVTFALAGCGGAGTVSGAGTVRSDSTTLSPEQRQKEEEAAGNLCDGLKYYGWDNEVIGVQVALDWMSEADAINFIKKIASRGCPELLLKN